MYETGNQKDCDAQRPAGSCCFYRRFVRFKIVLLRSVNDSIVYQSLKVPDICSIFEFQAVLECFVDSLAIYAYNGRKQSHRIHTFPQIIKESTCNLIRYRV